MNFDQAVNAHSAWKTKLRDYIAKHDGSLSAAAVATDNQCDLGKWIYGEGKAYERFPEYAKLKSEHAKFHKVVADVVQDVNAGKHIDEKAAMGPGSQFASLSSEVVLTIMNMKKAAGKQPGGLACAGASEEKKRSD